jgi:hypothetical protein
LVFLIFSQSIQLTDNNTMQYWILPVFMLKKYNFANMASPINITPTLKGKSSAYFNKQLKMQEQQKVTPEEKERMLQMMRQVLNKSNQKK